MASGDLLPLWKLHKIDTAIVEIRKRAAALDGGKAIQAEITRIQAEFDTAGGNAKSLSGEQHDIELRQKGYEEKIDKFSKQLFGGSVVNPREVENLQREIASLRKHREELDERLLELWEVVPPAKSAAEAVGTRLAAKKAELDAYRTKVVTVRQKLEEEFKARMAERPTAAAAVPKITLERYDTIREKHAGIGLSLIAGRPASCEMCGTLLPERLIEGAKEERIVTCDACHRILYWHESAL